MYKPVTDIQIHEGANKQTEGLDRELPTFLNFLLFLPTKMEADSICNPLLQLTKIDNMILILIGPEFLDFTS